MINLGIYNPNMIVIANTTPQPPPSPHRPTNDPNQYGKGKRKRNTRQQIDDDDDDEDEYDMNDPFINDDSSEEYVPSNVNTPDSEDDL